MRWLPSCRWCRARSGGVLRARLAPMPILAVYVLVELLTFVLLGWAIGFGWALLVVVGLFFFGVALAAWQMKALTKRALGRTDHPGKLTADMALAACGAFLVALPGIVVTLIGILLLLPPTRAGIRTLTKGAVERKLVRMGGASFVTVSRYGARGSDNVRGWGEVIDHRADEAPGQQFS